MMVHAHGGYRARLIRLRPLGIILLAPAIVLLSALILLALLGIFVIWLSVVGVLVAAIVVSDLVRRSMRRFARLPVGAPARRAIGYPGR